MVPLLGVNREVSRSGNSRRRLRDKIHNQSLSLSEIEDMLSMRLIKRRKIGLNDNATYDGGRYIH